MAKGFFAAFSPPSRCLPRLPYLLVVFSMIYLGKLRLPKNGELQNADNLPLLPIATPALSVAPSATPCQRVAPTST